ncbi:MAG TPA: TRAP transporter substrate-binding protein DctP [Xanthobacteraceae bacterium]|nr:TRAP transporter substrate-binding protein DctP [Xanthobacteraceae bacterium]
MAHMPARCAALLGALLAATAAAAEPIGLKLAFFSSDRSTTYLAAIRPFVDAVNAEAKGLLDIRLYPSGALGKEIARQPQIVLDGTADLAFIVPGYTPELFPDNAVIELPGLFRDAREASHVHTRLVAERALKGYRDFFVIGAYESEPETIHGRVPLASITDLQGKRIRVNNPEQAAALQRLGAIPVAMQVTAIADALSSGAIDAATVSRIPLSDFGISRVATHHYLLPTSGAPVALVMRRRVFDGLPAAARAVIQKYSGWWAAERFAETYASVDRKVLGQLASDSKRQLVEPSRADLKLADEVFQAVRAEIASSDPHRQSLLRAVDNELSTLRSTK